MAGQSGCSLRWAAVDGTFQGNGPKDLLHFYGFLSFFFVPGVRKGLQVAFGQGPSGVVSP